MIQQKIDSPSTPITIDPIVPVLKQIDDVIDGFNKKITENNKIIEKQDLYKTECKELIWNFLVSHLITKIEAYQKNHNGLQRGIQNLTIKLKTQQEKIAQLEKNIINKEAQLTSVLPTVDAINQILSGFGFDGFSLAENPTNPGTYKIIRPDGSDAKQTLSEGEYNFISFLYFYHLCYGSHTNSGIKRGKILVIDDPISSLDSNVLFIVSTLIKSIITHCRNNEKGIKQIFILTHNVYFHSRSNKQGCI